MTDTSYTITEEDTNGNLTLPGSVNITYTCNKGYKLQHPSNSTACCEYVTPVESDNKDVITKPMWTSTDEIICAPGQYTSSALLSLIKMWEGAGFGTECISVICAGQELNKIFFEKCKTGNLSHRKTVALT